MDATKTTISSKDRDFIRSKLLEGWTHKQLAEYLDVEFSLVGKAVREYGLKTKFSKSLLEKMRESMDAQGIFGKKCDETEKNIITLLRKGVPPNIVGDFMGLRCNPSTLDFYEQKKVTFQDKCKQARVESAIKLIIAANTNPKPNEALRLLSQSDVTRGLYKVPKEQKEAIQIKFGEFNRETEIIEDEED